MTTIVFHRGVMAADSQVTMEDDAMGHVKRTCSKLYRREIDGRTHIIGLQGESYPGLVFLDWFCKGKDRGEAPANFIEGGASFTALVLSKAGLYEYDQWCRGDRVTGRYHAIGSGAKAAYGALAMGANARTAVAIAARFDPYTARPIVTMTL